MALPCTYKPPRNQQTQPCEVCGHTGLVHPGNQHNPGIEACVLCELLPERDREPAEPRPPLPPPVSAHIVIGDNGWIAGTTDAAAATAKAREVNGVVISWVVSADYRKARGHA
ncbi:hypothetical protein ALI144C_44885 [Actinosynnema sp. ALI-1.44]|uniref:hypothetical protein n=1 Tax=Actinosynnema sp. ALI-1.44 TaxID=1933779 RepID=UPI00097C1864|nr:hypothetical protein [Actinosynnema sp. ALI-1.44]ONI73089.1 hypothetical protein ALI144C_44885 [Actinosynnema sp. ALI-1.44]